MNTKLIYSRITAFAFLVLLSNFSYAQQVLSSSGETGQNNSGSISYTLGELVIATQTNGTNTITQGFHQTQIIVTAVQELSDPGFSISAFPNPTNDFVILKIEKGEYRNIEFALFDALGKFLVKEKLTDTEQKVSFEQLNPGNYFIKILKNRTEIKTFKIVKTH
jgi:hypothetical protein